ncbi:Interferon-related developmental regulator, N-terminal [Dillenia turbinata]|uniref:Interferon-related developmental regulator, N-terminal n=1 Tax=Dillenia turbinata TaxID=194707 RepID=A0AAN8WC94_9MAGN
MGKRLGRRKMVEALREEETESKHSRNSRNKHKTKQLDLYLKQLFEKRESTREDALCSIVEGFTNKLQHQFAEKNFATMLDRCLKSVKLGSAKEIGLACHAIGLLVLTNRNESNAREAYEESLPVLSESLKSNPELVNILQCLAIVTFVGAQNAIETETSMLVLWQYISESSDSKSTSESKNLALAMAISAWSFLLSTLDAWDISCKHWKSTISQFFDLLDADEVVGAFASQALLLIVHKGCLAKFTTDSSDNVLNEVKIFSAEHGNSTKTSCQMIQLKFFKHFLGAGFSIHMKENQCFRDIFNFEPKKAQLTDNDFCKPEIIEVSVQLFRPDVKREVCHQRLFKSPNSIYKKGKTQLLNKLRLQSQERNFGDGYAADD